MTVLRKNLLRSRRRSTKSFISLAIISALVANFSLLVPAHSANQPRKILTGWIPYYSIKTSLPAALNNSDLINEVMPFWYTLKYDGKNKSAFVSDLYASANPSVPIATPLAALRGAGFKVIPTITDGMDKLVLSNLLSTPANRTKTAKTIYDFVTINSYDGIDLDFEGFAFVDGNATWAKTAPFWVAFVKELSALLHANNKLLSVSTPYNFNPSERQKGYTVYAWPQIAAHIDRLRIMTYDYSVAKVGPIGPLSWTEKTVAYATSIMPASKVYLGLAGYGRDWVTKVDGVCPAPFLNAIKVGAKAATFVMRDAATLAANYKVTPIFDEKFGEATFTYTKAYEGNTADGRSTICTATRTAWYQNAQSYKLRAELVAKYKLGGLTAWTLGMEEPLAMEAIRQTALKIAPAKVLSKLVVENLTARYGSAVNLSGELTYEDKSPAAALIAHIEGKSVGDLNWRKLGSVSTGVDGKFETSILLAKPMSVRIATDSNWESANSLSNDVAIQIDRTISLSAPGSEKVNVAFAINGTIRPRATGSTINLLKFTAGAWKNVATTTTNESGDYSFSVAGETRSIIRYQVMIQADPTWRQVVSPEFSIIIR